MLPKNCSVDHVTCTAIHDHAYADLLTIDKFGNVCRIVDLEYREYALPSKIEIYLLNLSHKLGVLRYDSSTRTIQVEKQMRSCNTKKKQIALQLSLAFFQRHVLR